MLNTDEWNRKETLPQDTIKRISHILCSINIPTNFVAEYSYKELWFSNRLEICGMPYIGSNGKGVTEEYAKASAYGEFIERLQSGFLLRNLYPNKQSSEIQTTLNHEYLSEVFSDQRYGKREEITQEIAHLLSKYPLIPYFDLNGNTYDLPNIYIDLSCASSGLAAGNSFSEAYCQGLGEIFERFAVRKIYYDYYSNNMFRYIEEQFFKNTNSYQMIKAMEDKGFTVSVIDCTIENTIPVLGVFMLDASKSKYYFKLASDINIDICLQRCITEIFQGTTFDLNFRLNMSPIDSKYSGDFWNDIDIDFEYTKAIIDGTGRLPRRFIKQIQKPASPITIFQQGKLSNDTVAKILTNIAKKLSDKILISNLTRFGFPTIRIYIPYISECFFFHNRSFNELLYTFDKLKCLFRENEINDSKFLYYLIDLINMHPYTYGFNLTKLLGILLSDSETLEYIYNPNLLVSLLALYHHKQDLAREYIKKYFKESRLNAHRLFIENTVIEAIISNVEITDLLEYLKLFNLNNDDKLRIYQYYQIAHNGVNLKCESCLNCCIKEICQYDKIKIFLDSIEKSKQAPMEKEFQKFLNLIV